MFITEIKILYIFFFFFFTDQHEIPSTGCVSVKDFLRHGCNFTSLEM